MDGKNEILDFSPLRVTCHFYANFVKFSFVLCTNMAAMQATNRDCMEKRWWMVVELNTAK